MRGSIDAALFLHDDPLLAMEKTDFEQNKGWGSSVVRGYHCLLPQCSVQRSVHLCSFLRSARLANDMFAEDHGSLFSLSLFHEVGNLCLGFWRSCAPPWHGLQEKLMPIIAETDVLFDVIVVGLQLSYVYVSQCFAETNLDLAQYKRAWCARHTCCVMHRIRCT